LKTCPACSSARSRGKLGRAGLSLLVCLDCASERLASARDSQRPEEIYREAYFVPWGMNPGSPAWRQRSATVARRVERLLAMGARGRLLDVGCAGGYLLSEASALGFDPYGIEISKHAVAVAESVAPGRVKQGIVEEAGYEKSSFGAITLFDVLEHHSQPAALLSLLRELLEAEGWLALSVPDVDSLSHALMGSSWPHYKEEHLWYPSREGLRGLLSSAGFRIRWEGRAVKSLSVAFMAPLLRQYPVPVLTPLFDLARRALPRGIAEATFSVSIGERFVLAQKS